MKVKASKANTLLSLKEKLTLFEVPNLFIFKVSEYEENELSIISKIQSDFSGKKVACRSSAASEDGTFNAMAGEFESVLNIEVENTESLKGAIENVRQSYIRKGARSLDDEIFIQTMVRGVSMSGVIFTHDLNTGAPYYVVNYDDISGLTDTVTSGGGEYSNRTLYIHRSSAEELRSNRFITLLTAVQELEAVLESQFLDIEFALDDDLKPYLLQVRPITTQPNYSTDFSSQVDMSLDRIQEFVKFRFNEMQGVLGKTSILGQMPDWNPAEMIGRVPRALAHSMYKNLITDNAWRIARENMGYNVPRGHPLMVSLEGQPFIDTRISFNSFLPSTLNKKIGEKLVNKWLNTLRDNPELHDKVEFDVAITAYCFNFEQRCNILIGDSLDTEEKRIFKDSIKELTINLIQGTSEGSIEKALDDINKINDHQFFQKKDEGFSSITSIYSLIEDCIRFGTIPFSILARHGFIAKSLMQSLIDLNVLSNNEMQKFESGIKTVATNLVEDMHQLQEKKLSRHEFMAEYGHLRPGTYDIMSTRYDQIEDFGSSDKEEPRSKTKHNLFKVNSDQEKKINALLKKESINNFNVDDLFSYITEAIVGREYGKFIFTKYVSNILELIAKFGQDLGLTREQMSHIPLEKILAYTTKTSENSLKEELMTISKLEEMKYQLSTCIRLPQILTDEAGVRIIPFQVSQPNFITQKEVTKDSVILAVNETPNLHDKIVLIENADPGFDWIFSQDIAGLITKYGGANSHMAIRCAEFGIPAAIGCGEQRYDLLKKGNKIRLDCAARVINLLG